ncbi:MAG: SDR family oxidoreductase, partial [Verrucomicrobiota bacterium]|nr:SDR family oxidoreductase [Verrucomicrobiota bacterium]
MDFLKFCGKKIAVFGVANKRSVAWFIAKTLSEAGAEIIFVVKDDEIANSNEKRFGKSPVYICDVGNEKEIEELATEIKEKHEGIDGIVHSIAFANYSEGFKPFHETLKKDFLQALDISCFSLVNIVKFLKPCLNNDASIITISISSTRMAAENYGYMAPIKAALDSSVVFLAKSLSKTSKIRVNAIGAGLLKTSASAGIPGYIDSYLFAEKATLRKKALKTQEVA